VFRVALRLLLAAALGAAPMLARADVYRWVDDSGLTHFATTRDAIPRKYRDSATVIQPPAATIANPSSSKPPARVAPPPAANPPAQAAPIEPQTDDHTGPGEEFAPPPVDGGAAPAPAAPAAAAPASEPPSSAAAASAPPAAAPAPAPVATPQSDAPRAMAHEALGPEDPRKDEITELEGQIERDREALRELISTPRWDSAELASDPRVREIAERLPRLQAELAALRTEAGR
jgi:uncharacterized protein DUF4124